MKKDASARKARHSKDSRKEQAPKKARKISDKQRAKDMEAELAKVKRDLEKCEQELANKENQPGGGLRKYIPKPKGSACDGFSLIEAMGLVDDEELYRAIMRAVRDNAAGVGLDWCTDFRKQDPVLLGRAYKLAREEFPILSKYANDWPQAEIIRQWFANRRRHAVREGYLSKRKERLAEAIRAGRVPLIDGQTRKKRGQQRRKEMEEDDEESSEDEGEGNEDQQEVNNDEEGGEGAQDGGEE